MKRTGFKPRKTGLQSRSRLKPVSDKKRAYRASKEGGEDKAHIDAVKRLACCGCGDPPPSDAHHPRDKPPFDEQGIYKRLPGASLRSHDFDAVPLCRACHSMYHLDRPKFHKLYGKDYDYIDQTRRAVRAGGKDTDDA